MAAVAEKREEIKVRVRPGKVGYYDHRRWRGGQNEGEGDVFTLRGYDVTVVDRKTGRVVMENGKPKMKHLTADDLFSERWMEEVTDNVPEKITTAPQALAAAQAILKR